MKEIRLRPQISDNDLQTVVNRTKKWFKKGQRVKVVVGFKGRQHIFMETLGPETIQRFLTMLGTYKVINPTSRNGRRFFAVIDP